MANGLTPTVAYVRASDDDQDGSCGQQRGLIGRYAAAHGYDILRWYEDDGISGLTAEDRPRFRAMTADLALDVDLGLGPGSPGEHLALPKLVVGVP